MTLTYSPVVPLSRSDPLVGAALCMAPCSQFSSQFHSQSGTRVINQPPIACHPVALPITSAHSSASSARASPSPARSSALSGAGRPLTPLLASASAFSASFPALSPFGFPPSRNSQRVFPHVLPRASPNGLCIHPLRADTGAPVGLYPSTVLSSRDPRRGSVGGRAGLVRVRAAGGESEKARGGAGAGAISTQRARELQRYQSTPSASVTSFIRFLYGTATYGVLATVAIAGAHLAGLDWSGGFEPSLKGLLDGFAFSAPPIALVLALFQDRVAERWEVVRAVRDADDEEAEDFFQGMAVWQQMAVTVAAAVSEELFFRAAVQAFITRTLLLSGSPSVDVPVIGMAALTGCLPAMAPCTQLCAATLTAALAGTMHYAMALPRDAVIVVSQSYSLMELRSAIRAWHERQEHQKIYPPMWASFLSLYYGIEWVMTGNLLAPIITHSLLNLILLHMSLVRVSDDHSNNKQPPTSERSDGKQPQQQQQLPRPHAANKTV